MGIPGSLASGSQEEELGVYYPYGRLPEPPKIHQEETGKPILRCVFPESGTYLVRGYNSYGEEVFTFSCGEFPAPVWKGTATSPAEGALSGAPAGA
jgi:hypothetical protein